MEGNSSWRDRLSRLDVDRECTVGTSRDSCWLCDRLEDWNSVLSAVQLTLVEWQPGKLCLSAQAIGTLVDFRRNEFPYDAAYVTAWLPKKHWCVEALDLGRCHPHPDETAVARPFPGLRPSGLRKISITDNLWADSAPFDWATVLDALGSIEQLNILACRGLTVSDRLASKLAELLSANANSVTELSFSGSTISSRATDILFRGILNCKTLRELIFDANLGHNSLAQFTNWLHRMETLEVLSLREGFDEDEDHTLAWLGREQNEEVVPDLGDLLRKSTSLNELRYQPLKSSAIIACLQALETNIVLRHLVIAGCNFSRTDIDHDMALLLKSMLAKNRGLHSLTFVNYSVDYEAAVLISDGLQENSTLKCLCVSASKLLFPAELAFCNSLKKNPVVRLMLGSFSRSAEKRSALSAELERNKWYSRVQIEWSNSDVAGLSASLLDQSLRPSDFRLITSHFSDESFSMLCSALSSSLHLHGLTVILSYATPSQVTSLHKVLLENKSLRSVSLYEIGHDVLGSFVIALEGLCFNDSVAELSMQFENLDVMFVELVAMLLETNETLCKVTLRCELELEPEYVEVISRGLLQNKFITDFSIHHGRSNADCSTACSRTAVQRNVTCLHRAVRFVLGRNLGKLCAEAFELFEEKASLVPRVMSSSGMSQAQAERAVMSARHFIRANYLIITRVVCQKLECYAADSTQIDQLNADCWRAITGYLTVSDVVDN